MNCLLVDLMHFVQLRQRIFCSATPFVIGCTDSMMVCQVSRSDAQRLTPGTIDAYTHTALEALRRCAPYIHVLLTNLLTYTIIITIH